MFAKELRVAPVQGRVNGSAALLKGYSQLSRVMPFGECPVSRRTFCHINNAARFVLHSLLVSQSAFVYFIALHKERIEAFLL